MATRTRKIPTSCTEPTIWASLFALLAYPFLVEPHFRIAEQSRGWTVGYGLLALLVAAFAVVLWYTTKAALPEAAHSSQHSTATAGDGAFPAVTPGQRLHWIALSFVPSSLLLGVTTYVTTDIAAAPLLWVIPLAIYRLTFVLVFARRPLVTQQFRVRVHAFAILPLIILFFLGRGGTGLLERGKMREYATGGGLRPSVLTTVAGDNHGGRRCQRTLRLSADSAVFCHDEV